LTYLFVATHLATEPMRQLIFLIQVSRPIVWPILPLVYAFGLRASSAQWDAAVIMQMILLTFPMNLIGCGLNDIYDYESDRRSARRRAIWGAVVLDKDRPIVWWAALAMAPVILVGAIFTGNWINVLLTASLLLVAWAYSVPPVRLKERPPLDSLANGLGYFLLPFAMGYSLGADVSSMLLKYYLLALCVAGIHALATAADYEADRAAGHRTFAVAFGRRAAVVFALAAFLLTALAADFQGSTVRIYVWGCVSATAIPALFPRERLIVAASSLIYGGFLVAATLHLLGW
jgi:4-hydroxybenzoate polyprenyltransferase